MGYWGTYEKSLCLSVHRFGVNLMLGTSTAELVLITTFCGKLVMRKISNAVSLASNGPYHTSLRLNGGFVISETKSLLSLSRAAQSRDKQLDQHFVVTFPQYPHQTRHSSAFCGLFRYTSCLTSIGFPIIKITRSHYHLIFIMGIPILVKRDLYIETWVREMYGHYNNVKMGAMASQITSRTTVYSTVYSGADQRKHQRSASLAFVRGIHR